MTYHPDHIAVHHWVTAAWEDAGSAGPAAVRHDRPIEHLDRFGDLYEEWNMYMSDERPAGVPPSRAGGPRPSSAGADLDRKLAALRGDGDPDQRPRRDAGPRDLRGAQVAEEAFIDARRVLAAPASPGDGPVVVEEATGRTVVVDHGHRDDRAAVTPWWARRRGCPGHRDRSAPSPDTPS